jgi:7-cyano-7-deazaguanine synthase
MDKAGVLLVSGGIESTTLLAELVDSGTALQGLFLDYGQRGAKLEREAAAEHCDRLGVELVCFDLASVGEQFRNVQTRKPHVPIAHRNLVALSLALSYATSLESGRVYIGVNRADTSAYPSASHLFLAQFRVVAGVLGAVQVVTPYIDVTKAEIIQRGTSLGIDYATTYSCMVGYAIHCGRCTQCVNRRQAFAHVGIEEPADFYRV